MITEQFTSKCYFCFDREGEAPAEPQTNLQRTLLSQNRFLDESVDRLVSNVDWDHCPDPCVSVGTMVPTYRSSQSAAHDSASTYILNQFLFLLVAISLTYTTTIAQDTKQGLARPEWQLRADLEFRLSCQSSLQKLCLELFQSHQKDPTDSVNLKLLIAAGELLETIDGRLPSTLPEHPSSIEYVKARKAAVIEWNKAYKAKGRDLPAVALDSERKFQDTYRDINEPSQNSTQVNSQTLSGTKDQSTPTDPGSKSSPTQRFTVNKSKTAEKKLEEATIKSAANLIKEINKYRSTEAVGDTTLERDLAERASKEAVTRFAENQPDYYFTYPIRDVSGMGAALEFTVDEPVEFEQLRKELGEDFQLTNLCKTIDVKDIAILKMRLSIKPGDLLRVRFKVSYFESGRNTFAVSHIPSPSSSSSRTRASIFLQKAIVGFQFVKQPAKTETSP